MKKFMTEFKGLSLFGKSLVITLGSISVTSVLTGAMWAGAHFATAKEVTVMEARLTTEIGRIEKAHVVDNESLKQIIKSEVNSIKIERMEDELYRLDHKRASGVRLSPEDTAIYELYVRKTKK